MAPSISIQLKTVLTNLKKVNKKHLFKLLFATNVIAIADFKLTIG